MRAITFLGNTAFPDSDLQAVMVTKESRWWQIFGSNDNYDPNRLDYDREQLRKFYTNRGYYDFRVLSAIAELAPDDSAFGITITLDEALAIAPAYLSGTVLVTVTTSTGGTSNGVPFNYVPVPALNSISPNQGSTLGGTTVTLTGSFPQGVRRNSWAFSLHV